MTRVSRRAFVRLGAAGAAAAPWVLDPAAIGAATVTAQDIVDRVRQAVGVEWKAATVDTFKAGDPSTPVTAIVTTSLATIDVLRRAVKVGANLIVTAGPTFYSRADTATPPTGRGRGAAAPPAPDPIFAAKSDFINAHNLVVWRFSDHWRLRAPDPLAQGVAAALGWAKYATNGDPARLTVPVVTLEALAARVKSRLDARGGVRVVGRPQTRVRTIGVLPGTRSIQDTVALLPQVDAIIAGEIREWESSEYARDVVNAGLGKGLILIGRSLSEDAGMRVCADWLRPIVPEAPVRWLPAGDPVLEAHDMTAGEVVDRIKTNLGAPWRDATYRDTFKSGGPDTPVTGIATTVFASLDVIQRAVAAGLNMIVPHEVTYWNDRDDKSLVSADSLVYTQKLEYLAAHNVVIFRTHDSMHDQRPDLTFVGSARDIGLDAKYETSPGSHRFILPETTLGALAASVQRRAGARALRVVGDPNARVSRIQLGVGYATGAANTADVDVVISGEQQEVDGVLDSPEYVLDAAALGIPKGWIMLGHAVSEEAGMLEMAQWIKGFVPEVPVQLVKAGEPFWAPK